MDREFWHQRWRSGQIGFHGQEPHWALLAHWSSLNLSGTEPVLVPLCGKSLDMHWLRERGYPVDGVELDPLAVQQFFAEWPGLPPGNVETKAGADSFAANGIRLWNQDFFDFRPQSGFAAFYDRAALIALPEPMRPRYMAHLRCCLQDGASGLLVAMEYPQSHKDGPPFSVSFEEVSAFHNFDAELLERRDILAHSPRFRDQGVSSLHETVYRLIAT